MPIKSFEYNTDGGTSTVTTPSTNNINTIPTVSTTPTPSASATAGNDIYTKYTPNVKTSIEQFKAASESITQSRKDIKSQMDELANNIYSTLNQLNFSVKLITDVNNFLSKYINSEESIEAKLTYILTNAIEDEITLSLYDNVAFNSLFIKSVMFYENFARLLMDAISHYLTYDGSSVLSIEAIHEKFCSDMFIKNDWEGYHNKFNQLNQNYNDIMSITPMDISLMTDSQIRLTNEYLEYQNIFNNLELIFNIDTEYTSIQVEDIVVPNVQAVINFKSGSIIYDTHLDRLALTIDETSNVINRIIRYTDTLINMNKQYNPNFKDENTYLSTIVTVCTISNDLLATLMLKYPNKDSRQGLVIDGEFTKVLTTINNLFRREIETFTQLLDTANKDYKLIKSLETFISSDKSIDNEILFDIMSEFDQQVADMSINDVSTLASLLRPYFEETGDNVDVFGNNSYTKVLVDMNILTEPMYDLLNYYRLFLYPFLSNTTSGASLIFDLLESLYIYNISITNQQFNSVMKQLFEIKINNIDYININASKVNESLTARYEGLNYLNYYDIQPYVDIIKSTDTDSISTIADLSNLFNPLSAYNLIQFNITENILYNNVNLYEIMTNLSIKTNIRTLLMKLMHQLAISNLINKISTYYSNNVPANLQLYIDLNTNTSDFKQDLNYLKLLITASDYYNGTGTIFNNDKIKDWYSVDPNDYIWDPTRVSPTNQIKKLFTIYKEV